MRLTPGRRRCRAACVTPTRSRSSTSSTSNACRCSSCGASSIPRSRSTSPPRPSRSRSNAARSFAARAPSRSRAGCSGSPRTCSAPTGARATASRPRSGGSGWNAAALGTEDIEYLHHRAGLDELRARLAATLDAVTPDQAAAITARVLHEREYAEIASEFQTTPRRHPRARLARPADDAGAAGRHGPRRGARRMSRELPPVLDDLRDQLREAAAREIAIEAEVESRVADRVRRGRPRRWLLVTLGRARDVRRRRGGRADHRPGGPRHRGGHAARRHDPGLRAGHRHQQRGGGPERRPAVGPARVHEPGRAGLRRARPADERQARNLRPVAHVPRAAPPHRRRLRAARAAGAARRGRAPGGGAAANDRLRHGARPPARAHHASAARRGPSHPAGWARFIDVRTGVLDKDGAVVSTTRRRAHGRAASSADRCRSVSRPAPPTAPPGARSRRPPPPCPAARPIRAPSDTRARR